MREWMLGSLIALAAVPLPAAELAGSVELRASGQPLRSSEAVDAVVYFRPAKPASLQPPAQPLAMATRRKQFVPAVLPVVVGSTVSFPNEDPIRHNAFSTSPGNGFDTGSYAAGEGVSHTFRSPGLVKVYCNVHHAMYAYILVLDTPHFTRPGPDGRFRLSNLPAGPGELVVFHDRASPWQQALDPATAGPVAARIELAQRKVPPHDNKFGKPYRNRSGRGY